MTYINTIIAVIPLIILIVCYVRIFLKIAQKANEGKNSKKQSIKPGKVHLQSTPSSSLPKAKIKTLKMTIIIVLAFIICGLPYPIVEMIFSYGNHALIPREVYAVLGSMAVANSAINPYVFLLFNANVKCLSRIFKCCGKKKSRKRYFDSTASTRSEFTCTMNTDLSRMDSKVSTYAPGPDVVEMSALHNKVANGKKQYTVMAECD